jgi:hypothetical protein
VGHKANECPNKRVHITVGENMYESASETENEHDNVDNVSEDMFEDEGLDFDDRTMLVSKKMLKCCCKH